MGRLLAALIYLFVSMLSTWPSEADAAEAPYGLLELRDSQQALSLNDRMELLPDDAGHLSYADMSSPDIARQFSPIRGRIAFGYASSVYWFRFAVRNDTPNDKWIVQMDNPLIERIQMYASVEATPLRGNYPAYELKLPPGETTFVYFRLATDGEMTTPLQAVRSMDVSKHANEILFLFRLVLWLDRHRDRIRPHSFVLHPRHRLSLLPDRSRQLRRFQFHLERA
ncbi:7TMR-DISMED2 domain-containing protein [Cohnella rhizosphaerae]|uniref:7TM-DISM receptor extracellular domain-containing protein n=1 Tax=Cohnella rhizosphaerae TaxID=1457232 RepID=A0A9X4KY84_9BACL|nr:7TM-DISM domain-containing protein [Cohnella rhizosphaerae]MDG0813529.1 hypothetical protein [Cohnella rhizosphaerae]